MTRLVIQKLIIQKETPKKKAETAHICEGKQPKNVVIYIYIYILHNTYTDMYVHMWVCVCVCVYIYIYI